MAARSTLDKKEVKCSQIFKWYREDFGKNDKDVRYYLISVQRCRGLVDMSLDCGSHGSRFDSR